jgi:hypothetical protein
MRVIEDIGKRERRMGGSYLRIDSPCKYNNIDIIDGP